MYLSYQACVRLLPIKQNKSTHKIIVDIVLFCFYLVETYLFSWLSNNTNIH